MEAVSRAKAERAKIAECVAILCEAFNRKPTAATYMAYDIGLDGVPVVDIQRACRIALSQPREFMPSPGELRQLAGETPPEARADAAFGALRSAISRYGYCRSPDFDDPLINAVVRNLGGWERACEMDVDEFETWYRKEFSRVYGSFCRTGITDEQAMRLLGSIERLNIAGGFGSETGNAVVCVQTGLPWVGKTVPRIMGGTLPCRALLGTNQKESQ